MRRLIVLAAAIAICGCGDLNTGNQPKTYLASVVIELGSAESISEFAFDTWGIQYEAVCHIPSGWRIQVGSSATLKGVLKGEGSHGATWLDKEGLQSLRSLVLVTIYAPIQQQDDRGSGGKVVIPATFKGHAIVSDGERRVALSDKNVRLTPATRCPIRATSRQVP